MPFWKWNERSRRYYVTSEGASALGRRPGSFIGSRQVEEIADALVDKRVIRATGHALDISDGSITLTQWFDRMSDDIKSVYISEYVLARGGRDMMTPSDWGRIGGLMKNQRRYLHGFAERIGAGEYSERQIAAYSRMYINGARTAFERGKVAARNMPDLPAYPGDGGTVCLTNCRCHWKIVDRAGHWVATWKLGTAEHCEGCVDRSREYRELIIPKPIDLRLNREPVRQVIP